MTRVRAITDRQKQILACLWNGAQQKEVGQQLGITHKTVSAHLGQMRRRLRARTTVEMMRRALEAGVLTP